LENQENTLKLSVKNVKISFTLVQMDADSSPDRQAWMSFRLRKKMPIRPDPDLQHYLHVTSLSLHGFKANL
jgi:hypothetical protein